MPSESFDPQREERPTGTNGEGGTAEPEEGAFRPGGDRGESFGDPDVQLDVPVLNVDEIDLEVDDLRARVSFQAELADMVKINVGIDAEVGTAKISLQGVEAQAQLKARLDNVRAIFSEVLDALERDPDLAQNMLRSAGTADVLGGGTPAPDGAARQPAGFDEPGDAETATEDPESLADLPIEEEYVDEQGRIVGRARDESGRIVEGVLDDEGNFTGAEAAAEGEEAAEATDAARRRARELGVDLANVEGTGSGGRIIVKDVQDAARGGG